MEYWKLPMHRNLNISHRMDQPVLLLWAERVLPVTISTILFPNQCWYHLVGTYNNGVWNLYVNGILEATDASQSQHITQDGSASVIALGRKGTASDYLNDIISQSMLVSSRGNLQ